MLVRPATAVDRLGRVARRLALSAIMLIVAIVLMAAMGCGPDVRLVATPNLYLDAPQGGVFEHVPAALRTPEITLLYAADRAVERQTLLGPRYGSGRADRLVVGEAVVGVERTTTTKSNTPATWDQLVADSTARDRAGRYRLHTTRVAAGGELALPLKDMIVRDGKYALPPEAEDRLERGREELHRVLHERLALTPRKDVYIFVHGFANTFDEALNRIAMVWHFMGRVGVPVAYSWPAGYGGPFGYAYDRESGEYTVYHLKRFLLEVAACPQVERIHLIAHSRGTDVVVTALRELNIAFKAQDKSTQRELRLENLVLAAPDLDPDVFEQRFGIEDLHLAAGRTTVYLSADDYVLDVARFLFSSRKRLGNLSLKELPGPARAMLARLGSFDLIQCKVSGFSTSHDYAFAHPAVLSDLIKVLRDCVPPGAANGRPLRSPGTGVWEIDNDYLKPVGRE